MRKSASDVYQTITDTIIAAIEAGADNPQMPWHRSARAFMLPRNAATGQTYQGVNILALTAVSELRSYSHPVFATYRQWQSLGAQVRGGEKSALIVFYKRFDVEPDAEDEDDDGRRYMARASHVFNVAQVDDYALEELPPMPPLERDARVDAFIAATRADIRHGGERAFYRASTDQIFMPDEWRFCNPDAVGRSEDYYAVLFHELAGHWTAAPHRCNRQLGKRFGDDAYCMDELVSELASAFTCAELGISPRPREDHAQYLGHWLRVMKADNRAIFAAAARASEAVRYLRSLQAKADVLPPMPAAPAAVAAAA